MENMTQITRKMFESATRIQSVEDAARVLRTTGEFRTLGSILRSFSGSENPKNQLVDGLLEWNTGTSRESLDKKVRNWLGGKTRSVSKRDAFVLSRVLKLPLDRTDEFLKMVTGEGIHWRAPEDIAWAFAIVQDLTPGKTMALLEQVKDLGKMPKESSDPAALNYTADVRERLDAVLEGSEEDLMAFLQENRNRLGTLHNTAYSLFIHYMDLLERGYSEGDIEDLYDEMTREQRRKKEKDALAREETARREAEKAGREYHSDGPDGDTELYQPDSMTTREVLETYLYRKLVPVAERGTGEKAESFSAIQRSIRMNWPDEFAISKMRKRQLDVSRKVLILLFLATDGSNSEYEEEDEDEDLMTPDQIFRNIHTRMDLMLQSCGFQKLDPRSHFDWMVLYCICIGDLWEADERLQEMLMELFPEELEEEDE